MMTHMKTTLDLPDKIFRDAKATAARRQVTLKALITHALKREIYSSKPAPDSIYEVDEDGLPYLPSRGVSVTSDLVRQLQDDEDA